MGNFSDYAEQALLKHLFGIAAFTQPAIYVALSTSNPGETGAGIAEPSGGSYARVHVTGWSWNAGAFRIENTGAITFPTATASLGTIAYFAIFDASSSGNMLAYGPLSVSKSYSSGDTPQFAAADLQFSVSGSWTQYLQQKMLKHLFGIASYTSPATYIALSTADPGADGSGLAEPSGNGYTRELVNSSGWTWNGTSARVENNAAITFPTATGSWGTITYAAVIDASSSGNVLLSAALGSSKSFSSGDQASFDIAAFTPTLD